MDKYPDSDNHLFGNKMRSPLTVCVALVLFAFTAAFGMRVFRDTTVPPDPTLPEAYQKAISSLGKEASDFYCLSASAMANTETSEPTEWHLIFHSTNGQFREVIVPTKGKIIVRNKVEARF